VNRGVLLTGERPGGTIDDSETHLSAIDHLEGFLPGGPSLYRRVLVPVDIGQRSPVVGWVYVAPAESHKGSLIQLKEVVRWNPERK